MKTRRVIAVLVGLGLLIVGILVFLPRHGSEEIRATQRLRAEMVRLGYVDTEDSYRVSDLLNRTDINYSETGGHGLAVFAAATSDAARAIALISEDAKKHGYEFVELPSAPFKLDIFYPDGRLLR